MGVPARQAKKHLSSLVVIGEDKAQNGGSVRQRDAEEGSPVMALVLRGYSLTHRQFEVFWSDKHVGTYCPHDLPKQMKLLLGVFSDGDLINTWIAAFPDTTVLDWKQSFPLMASGE